MVTNSYINRNRERKKAEILRELILQNFFYKVSNTNTNGVSQVKVKNNVYEHTHTHLVPSPIRGSVTNTLNVTNTLELIALY